MFISPKVDYAFKVMMSREKVIRGFLSAVLHIPRESIKKVTPKETILPKRYESDKYSIMDVRVELEAEDRMDIVDVEMQVLRFPEWRDRTVYYNCRQYADQLREGDKYTDVIRCVHVGILDFILFEDEERFYTSYHLREDKSNRIYSDKLEFHVLELPKLERIKAAEDEEALKNWGEFLASESEEEMEMISRRDETLKEAKNVLQEIQGNVDMREIYFKRRLQLLDQESIARTYKLEGLAEGLKKGKLEGKLEGKIEGKLEGLQEGKLEGLQEGELKGAETKTWEIAQKMKLMDVDSEFIQKVTGLSIEDIDRILN